VLTVNPAPTVVLSSGATSVVAGQSFTLNWSSTDTSGCTASGGASGDGWSGPQPASGSATITESVSGTYRYMLSCLAGTESVAATDQVVITASATGGGSGGGGGGGGGGGSFDTLTLVALGLLVAALRIGSRQRNRAAATLDAQRSDGC
jgi:hypothetical protein